VLKTYRNFIDFGNDHCVYKVRSLGSSVNTEYVPTVDTYMEVYRILGSFCLPSGLTPYIN
jgi:hypothetical protein